MRYLLDTNVLGELRRRTGDPRVRRWASSIDDRDLCTSVLAIGEMRRGVESKRRKDPAQAERIDRWLTQLRDTFDRRILPVTVEAAEEWGRMDVPDRLPIVDGLMAATAKVGGLTLVTRNIKDVRRSGARLLNPFDFEG